MISTFSIKCPPCLALLPLYIAVQVNRTCFSKIVPLFCVVQVYRTSYCKIFPCLALLPLAAALAALGSPVTVGAAGTEAPEQRK